MGWQLKCTLGTEIGPCNGERVEQFTHSHHFEVLINQNQVKRKHHSYGVYRVSWHNPNTATRLECPSPQKANSLPKMESATFTRNARKVSLVLLYTKTRRCSFRTRILPMSFRIELTNANLSTFVAPTSHPTHSSQACRLPKEERSPERMLHSFERMDLPRMCEQDIYAEKC